MHIENKTFDEIAIGDTAHSLKVLSAEDIKLFAILSGDVNPAHLDRAYAEANMFKQVIAHGFWGALLIASVFGSKLPGPGSVYVSQTLKFRAPVYIGDTLSIVVKVVDKNAEKRTILFDCIVKNQSDVEVIKGGAEIRPPAEKMQKEIAGLPRVSFYHDKEIFADILPELEKRNLKFPARPAIVFPTSLAAFHTAVLLSRETEVSPLLIGPPDRLSFLAKENDLSLGDMAFVPADTSKEATEKAAYLLEDGHVDAIFQGAGNSFELFQSLRRTVPHLILEDSIPCYVRLLDIPSQSKTLVFASPAFARHPSLVEKSKAMAEAISFVRTLGYARPKVAILSHSNNIHPLIQNSLDACSLAKLGQRGYFGEVEIDGPMTLYSAIIQDNSETQFSSAVAGNADLLFCQHNEMAELILKQLEHFVNAFQASILLGARCPIIAGSRSDAASNRVHAWRVMKQIAYQLGYHVGGNHHE